MMKATLSSGRSGGDGRLKVKAEVLVGAGTPGRTTRSGTRGKSSSVCSTASSCQHHDKLLYFSQCSDGPSEDSCFQMQSGSSFTLPLTVKYPLAATTSCIRLQIIRSCLLSLILVLDGLAQFPGTLPLRRLGIAHLHHLRHLLRLFLLGSRPRPHLACGLLRAGHDGPLFRQLAVFSAKKLTSPNV